MMSLMEQQFVETNRYTYLQYTEKALFVCGNNILTEVVFVNCLLMWESEFDEFCGLRQIAILKVICNYVPRIINAVFISE
jgi:hypothetical protein